MKNEFLYLNKNQWINSFNKDLVESYFIKINIPNENCTIFLKFTFINSLKNKSASVWAIYFDTLNPENNIAIKENFSIEYISISKENFEIRVGENIFSENICKGKVQNEENKIEWDINFNNDCISLIHFPYEIMYEISFPKNKISSPILDSHFNGYLLVNDRKINILNKKGMQGHNYGPKHSDNWIWTHCNYFDNTSNAVFESISSRLNLGVFKTPPLTIIYFKYKNKELFFNSIIDFFKNKSILDGLKWKFQAYKDNYLIEGEFWGNENEFVGLNYYNPDNSKVVCVNSMAVNCNIILKEKNLFFYNTVAEFIAKRTAALEIGTLNGIDKVKVKV
jgi:hypothetical protein